MIAMNNHIHDLETSNEKLQQRIAKQEATNMELQETIQSYSQIFDDLRRDIKSHKNMQQRIAKQQEATNREQQEAIQNHSQMFDDLRHESMLHEKAIDDLRQGQRDGLRQLQDTIVNTSKSFKDQLQLFKSNMKARNVPGVHNEHTNFGCFSDEIPLICPSGTRINITNAIYGMYAENCTEDCCVPNAEDDCSEQVAENKPQDWEALKLTCNDKTRCVFEYTGASIDECQEDYLADYMQIYYDCLPDEPVGFTAYASQARSYTAEDVVIFDVVISDFGSYYSSDLSQFRCPYHGIYMFSVNFNSMCSQDMYSKIVLDGERLIEALAYASDERNHAGTLVLAECNAQQTVWVQATSDSEMVGGSARSSSFSGYLLHRLD